MGGSIILSFDKLEKLIKDKNYGIVSLYICNKRVVFIEVRTPKLQRSFIVYLPKKYKVKYTDDHYKRTKIYKSSTEKAGSNLEYLLEVKGPLLDCGLMSISSEMICLQKNNGEISVFTFEKNDDEGDDTLSGLTDISPIDQIIQDGEHLKKLLGDDENEEDGDSDGEDEIEIGVYDGDGDKEDNGAEEEDEIVAGDDKNEIVEELKVIEGDAEDGGHDNTHDDALEDAVDESQGVDEDAVLEEEEVYVEPKPKESSLKVKYNTIPYNIQDEDVTIGLIYYAIDLPTFHKKIKTLENFEKDIVAIYDALDDNESEIRDVKVDEIVELSNKLSQKAKEIAQEYKKHEMNLKSQILKLSEVLKNTEKIKEKVHKEPKRYTSSIPEVERLYNQTKGSIHEINIDIVKNRNTINDILEIYRFSMEEILKV